MGSWMEMLIFMIQCKYYNKNHHLRKYRSCHSNLGRNIYRIYRIEPILNISPSVLSRGSCKFLRYYHHCSHHLMIPPNCCIATMDLAAAPPKGIYSLATVPDGIFFLLPLSPELFRPYFAVTNLWVSCSLRHLHFLWKLFSRVSSKFLRDSMDNSYCKKDYGKGEEVK